MLTLVDNAVSGFPLLFVGLLELIIIAYVYGEYKVNLRIQCKSKSDSCQAALYDERK